MKTNKKMQAEDNIVKSKAQKGQEEEDLMAPHLDHDASPMILGGKTRFKDNIGDSRPNVPNAMSSEKMFIPKGFGR